MGPSFKEKSNYPVFCISGCLAVPVNPDKWRSIVYTQFKSVATPASYNLTGRGLQTNALGHGCFIPNLLQLCTQQSPYHPYTSELMRATVHNRKLLTNKQITK